ncbi:MAG TPA: AAA family ATPase [Polyangiaceae bacterium]|nr:AAA family ATPase [Polyangiaceae bacterium]
MRIAISGTHRSGKSTLIEELSTLLPKYRTVDEPYHLLVEDGYEFSHPPSLEDFVAQLERSLQELSDETGDVLFDRCPIDWLAYISVHADADEFDLDDWLPRVRAALRTMNWIVFVPIEDPDRIHFASSDDDDDSRELVDQKLKELLLEDSLDLDVEVLEVEGEVGQRARSVMRRIR